MNKLAFVDIETTGISYIKDRIIELAIIKIVDDRVVEEFSSLINPQTHVPYYIQSMTGINPSDVYAAPSFRQLSEKIYELLEDSIFVAHSVGFDYGFIKNEFRRIGVPINLKKLCTVKLSKSLFPEHRFHNLDVLVDRFNIRVINRHRAYDDAKAIYDFYKIVKSKNPEQVLTKAQLQIIKEATIPANVDKNLIDNLPESHGVYIFYDEGRNPLYVGKSVNIKERVLSHFRNTANYTKDLRISEKVKYIEAIETTGELGALLKESSLIKELMPLHNQMLRRRKKLVIVCRDNISFPSKLVLKTVDQIDVIEIDNILFVCKTLREAKEKIKNFADNYLLCKRTLGLDKGKGLCFDYHLEKCKGVCGGKEPQVIYNLRLEQAFIQERLKPWPFEKPILIKEEDVENGRREDFVIYKWCLIGNIKYSEDNYPELLKKDYTFDYDAYKILSKFILRNNTKFQTIDQSSLQSLSLQAL